MLLAAAGLSFGSASRVEDQTRGMAMLQFGRHLVVRAAFYVPAFTNQQEARVCFHQGTSDEQILEFCKHMPGQSHCLEKSVPYVSGTETMPCWMVQATEEELPAIAARLPGPAGSSGAQGAAGVGP